ncbi:dickkopf-related protein [Sorangium cellulosum]|nr:dickkopf-related protein [Sorangium cellulosum]
MSPILDEIVAVDETGEPHWPFGNEDVAGDGDTFDEPEQAIDFRTAYAVADAGRLWARAYVSQQVSISADVTLFVFIDADRNQGTGGPAGGPPAETVLNPQFTEDSSPGGYEYVLGVKGDGTRAGFWTFEAGAYVETPLMETQVSIEAGVDIDPVLINQANRGYTQASIELGVVSVSSTCDANLYFRSVNAAAALGPGDLDVGIAAPCVPADADDDRVPDVVVTPSGCSSDDDCAGNGVCVSGDCVLPVSCYEDVDCDAGEDCLPDGRCVPVASGTCTSNDDCGDLVCVDGQCTACTLGGDQCGAGERCAPTGRCVSGSASSGAGGPGGPDDPGIQPGDEVRGGACACATGPAPYGGGALSLLAVGGLALRWRRRPRRGPGAGR